MEKLAAALDKLAANPEIARLIALCDEALYSLTIWHIAVFGAVFALTILFLIAAAAFSRAPVVSLILQTVALGTLVIGPVVGYFWVERRFKPASIENLTIMPLYYQEKSIVFGDAFNAGEYPLSGCRVKAIAYEPPEGRLDYLRKLARPIAKGETAISDTINPRESRRFEIELDGARNDQNLTLSIALRCR
ncbi:MAG: DUF2393 domain-containing protein [Helicobacteraceae bacterium]|jgi:hypothetical protein|nr:DUF2393 domain-containing protein [Helicobacteraceae bacterium]